MNNPSGNWFSKLFKKLSQAEPKPDPIVAPKPAQNQDHQPGAIYKKGDFIGQRYEVYRVLGKGGFGVVYLVYSHAEQKIYALKTFRDEYLADQEIRKRFRREASVWIELGRHPYLVRAYLVDDASGRIFIAMEYIAPNEQGLNSLEDYLQRHPPDLGQSLYWAIQICHGMEYAYSKGVRAHRDLKPANIMITQDKTAKITDFGLASVFSDSFAIRTAGWGIQPGKVGLSGMTMLGKGFGTPSYMPAEQFDNAAVCDERSDIYSFGVILFQLASGGRLPFSIAMPIDPKADYVAAIWQEFGRLHSRAAIPRLKSPLMPIIERCLAKQPGDRYVSFAELRMHLERLLKENTGRTFYLPPQENETVLDLCHKAYSFNRLGRYQEALECYDTALACVPGHIVPLRGKAAALSHLGRLAESLACFDQATEIDPTDTIAWAGKGVVLVRMGRPSEGLVCLNRALEIDPTDADTLCRKANLLSDLSRYEEAIACAEQAIKLVPGHANALCEKGRGLHASGRLPEAAKYYDQALQIDPYLPVAWYNKGLIAETQGDFTTALEYHQRFLELAPVNYYQKQMAHSQEIIKLWGS
jgi:eukaryotic-like serine/threonine-protein kinase